MPAGYPVKVNYLTGDVLTAANLNDLAGTVNFYDPTAKGDLFPATAADTVSRLAVGANDTVLTADSTAATGMKWAAAGGGGSSFSLLNAGGTALTAAATITVSGLSGYNRFVVMLVNASSANASSRLAIRMNADATAKYSSYGGLIYAAATYDAANFTKGYGTQNEWRILQMSSNTGSSSEATVTIEGANSSGIKMLSGVGGATGSGGEGQGTAFQGGYYDSATVISSISALSSDGNFDLGTMFIYGSVV